jgi:fumarate hydratase subunit alpha
MGTPKEEFIRRTVAMLKEAETSLPADVKAALENALNAETNERAREQIRAILENVNFAGDKGLPICQDTGIPIFYVHVGRSINIDFDIKKALDAAVQKATELIPLRKNAVNPLTREAKSTPLLDVIYELVEGDRIVVDLLVKGAGSENVSVLSMLSPSDDLRKFVLETIVEAGGKPCPPIIVGIGVGSTFNGCAWLAKKTLFQSLSKEHTPIEEALLKDINSLGIGPMGLGGDTTALKVFVEVADCHTASLPVAVNIQCWANRRASFEMKQ